MTLRQQLLRVMYPVWMKLTRLTGKNTVILKNEYGAMPPASIYELGFPLTDGKQQSLSAYKGRKLLLVNTASDCGYTAQYSELQQLSEQYPDKLVVIAFPSNDFKQQEKKTDSEIARFCFNQYNIHFPLAAKSGVLKNKDQNEVYQWLTDKEKNGWNSKAPSWNFVKYLVNEDGILTHYFDPSISPLDEAVQQSLRS